MKRIIILCYLAASLLFCACDNYLDLVPKGQSVLNQTSDYLGLLEDMYGYPFYPNGFYAEKLLHIT